MTPEEKKRRNAERMRVWRAENRSESRSRDKLRNQDRYKRSRDIIEQAKDTPCMDCDVKYPYYVMQFDHRDPTEKGFAIGKHAWKFSVEILMQEIAKCDVVCANCHAERTHQQRFASEKLSTQQ